MCSSINIYLTYAMHSHQGVLAITNALSLKPLQQQSSSLLVRLWRGQDTWNRLAKTAEMLLMLILRQEVVLVLPQIEDVHLDVLH